MSLSILPPRSRCLTSCYPGARTLTPSEFWEGIGTKYHSLMLLPLMLNRNFRRECHICYLFKYTKFICSKMREGCNETVEIRWCIKRIQLKRIRNRRVTSAVKWRVWFRNRMVNGRMKIRNGTSSYFRWRCRSWASKIQQCYRQSK